MNRLLDRGLAIERWALPRIFMSLGCTLMLLLLIDWPFVGYGFIAVGIAVVFSSIELLTRYQSRTFREIFYSRYYVGFALLNTAFCFLVYWALPKLGNLVVKPHLAGSVSEGLIRSLTAGLGYLVIARLSILDIRTKDGSTYGAGFDAIYNAFAQFLLRHHARKMQQNMRFDFNSVFQLNNGDNERRVFKDAATRVRTALDSPQERTSMKEAMDLADSGQLADTPAYCQTIYLVIRDYTADRVDAYRSVADARNALAHPPAPPPA